MGRSDPGATHAPAANGGARPRNAAGRWPLVALAAGSALVAGLGCWWALERQVALQSARLEAVAELRAQQVAGWLEERRLQFRLLGRAPFWPEMLRRWQDHGDESARDRLRDRMREYAAANRLLPPLALDANGQPLPVDDDVPRELPAPLREAWSRAERSGGPELSAIYRDQAATPPLRLDVVVPLQGGAVAGRAKWFVVLRLDPEQALFPMLAPLAVPGVEAQTQIVWRVGDALVGPQARQPVPISRRRLLAGAVIRGDAPPGQALWAEDYVGQPVLGVVRSVPGTPWWLVVRLGRDEVYAPLRGELPWILAAALLAGVAGAALVRLVAERQSLRHATAERDHHAGLARELGATEAALQRRRADLEAEVAQRTRSMDEAVAALRASEGFTRLVADHLPARIAYWNRERRCLFANQAYGRWLNLPLDRIVGRTAAEVHGPAQAAQATRRVQRALAGEAQEFERTERRPDGSTGVTLMQYLPHRDDHGQVQGFVVLATDITALKLVDRRQQELNEALAQARDDAQAANVAKTAFLANMSHEIRAPLNAIVGLTRLLQLDRPAPGQASRLARIGGAAEHLLRLIDDILDLSKIEAGHLVLEHTEFALVPVLLGSLDMVAERARAQGVLLVLDADVLPARVAGDPTRLSQAIVNLLSNAVKFTEHGSVTLHARRVAQADGQVQLQFEVADTGIGIEHDKQALLFRAFAQADSSTTRRFGGTGLGLVITRRLAGLMGGDVGLSSEYGHGSRFWFTAWLESRSEQDVPAPRPRLQGLRAGVVEREGPCTEALLRMLQQLGVPGEAWPPGGHADGWVPIEAGESAAAPALLVIGRGGPPPGALHTPTVWIDGAEIPADLADPLGRTLRRPVSADALGDALERALGLEVAPPQAPRSLLTSAHALAVAHGGRRILLAEDNPVNREVAVELLRCAGLHVEVAADGAQAVSMAANHDYDLVLMDMQMPVLDGLAATTAIRNGTRNATVPVIALTANAFEDDREACLAAGMDDHVAKPVEPERLYALLMHWLSGASEPPPEPARGAAAVPAFDNGTIDTDAALLHVGGDEALLRDVRAHFVRHYAGGIAGLDAALAEDRRDDARRLVHGLRGAAVAVGAQALAREAEVLEALLSGGAPTASALAAVAQLQVDLREVLELLAEPPGAGGAAA